MPRDFRTAAWFLLGLWLALVILAVLCIAGAWGAGTLFGRLSAIETPGLMALARDPWVLGRGVLSGLALAAG